MGPPRSREVAALSAAVAPQNPQPARQAAVVAAAPLPLSKAPTRWEVRAPMLQAAVRAPRQPRLEAAAEQQPGRC